MAMILADRIRLWVDQTQETPIVDVFSGTTPAFYNGNDLQVELAFGLNGVLDNLSNVDQIRLQIKDANDINDVAFLDQTVPSGNFNQGLTLAQWQSGDPSLTQATMFFPNGQTALDTQGLNSLNLYLVISVLINGVVPTFVPADTTRSRASNVATLIIPYHNIVNGSVITVASAGGSGYNVSNVLVTVIDQNTISYPSTGSNESATADTTAVVTVVSVPPREVTVATGTVTVIESGFNTVPPAYVASPLYLTAAQSDARYTVSSTKVSKTGDTMSGPLIFSGTTNPGVELSQLNTTQRTALTGVPGMAVYDTTIGSPMFYMAAAWAQPVMSVNGATGVVTFTTDGVTQGSANLYMTNTGVTGQPLTGYVAAAGTVAATDTILQAFQKLGYFMANSGGGEVSSVGLSAPASTFTVSGSPVTSTGTLTLALASQVANYGFMGPASGGSATPTWRAFVAADIPAIPESGVTSLVADLAARLQLAGGSMTGPIQLVNLAGGGSIATPTSGMLIYDTVNSKPMFYTGAAWVDVATTTGSGFLPLAGGTLTGALNLVSGTPTGQNAVSATYLATSLGSYAPLAGATFSGSVNFSGGTTTFTMPNLTQAQINALTPADGMLVFNSSVLQPQLWNGTFWQNPFSLYGAVLLNGSTMTGQLNWNNTLISGLTLNNLSTTQMNALTPVAGQVIFNTTASALYYYTGAAWAAVGSGGTGAYLPLAGGTMTGSILFGGTTGSYCPIKFDPAFTTTQRNALTAVEGMMLYNHTTGLVEWYNGAAWVGITSQTGGASPLTTMGNGWEFIATSAITFGFYSGSGANQAWVCTVSGGGGEVDFTISNGNCNVNSNTYGYQVSGTKVVGGQIGGWTQSTGTALRTGWATGSATTLQVAETLKALIDDLFTHGLIA